MSGARSWPCYERLWPGLRALASSATPPLQAETAPPARARREGPARARGRLRLPLTQRWTCPGRSLPRSPPARPRPANQLEPHRDQQGEHQGSRNPAHPARQPVTGHGQRPKTCPWPATGHRRKRARLDSANRSSGRVSPLFLPFPVAPQVPSIARVDRALSDSARYVPQRRNMLSFSTSKSLLQTPAATEFTVFGGELSEQPLHLYRHRIVCSPGLRNAAAGTRRSAATSPARFPRRYPPRWSARSRQRGGPAAPVDRHRGQPAPGRQPRSLRACLPWLRR
jgi:hypothetical protein